MTFTTETEEKKGKFVMRVLYNGVEIGKRTSEHRYRFALVVKNSQARAIERAKEVIAYQLEEARKYDSIQTGAGPEYAKAVNRFGFAHVSKYVAAGEYTKWAIGARKYADEQAALLVRLESGPQPEFQLPYVNSWHRERRLVVKPHGHQEFVTVVEVA